MNKRIMITSVSFLIAATVFGQSKKTVTINIKDVRRSGEPAPQPSRHQHHDAVVFLTSTSQHQNRYVLVYYQKENDTVRYHKASYVSNDIMNKAAYTWDKDTIVLRLYNIKNKKEIKFKAFGNAATSSMVMDE